MYVYQAAILNDLDEVTELEARLHSSHEHDNLREEINSILRNMNDNRIFLCRDGDKSIAFAHVALRREYVEGTSGTRNGAVGYLEGIYVEPEYQKQGIARELVALCENWARDNNCAEFASDCKLNNTDSLKFHLKIGFTEAGRNIHFTKRL